MNRRDFLRLGAASAVLAGAVPAAASSDSVTVGGKNFTEQYLLAEMTVAYLTAHGVSAQKRDGMTSPVLRQSLTRAQVDLCWEYVGTSLVVFNGVPASEAMTRQGALTRVRELDRARGLVWLGPSAAGNSYALSMRRADATELEIATLGDLATYMEDQDGPRTLALNTEFAGRRDGLHHLAHHYGFQWPAAQLRRMPTARMLPALREGAVRVSVAFATDGALKDQGLVLLQDDRAFFPDYSLAPVVRRDLLDRHPDLEPLLEALGAHLTKSKLCGMNWRIDVEQRPVAEVARRFLEEEDLLG